MNNRYVLETLRELIAVRRDCEQGFARCAEYVHNEALRKIFMVHAHECAEALHQLEELVRSLGAEANGERSTLLLARRASPQCWASVASDEDEQILEECECGTSRVLEAYRNALDDPLPDPVREVLLRQFEGAVSGHDQIRELAAVQNPVPRGRAKGAGAAAGLE